MSYQTRVIEPVFRGYLEFFSAVAILGPRQSGKSSLIKHVLPDYQYVTFDNATLRQRFYDDPEKFMRIYHDRVAFDEAQKVPEIFDYVKIAVDEDRDRVGKFVLSGSSQFAMVKGVSESLAGRVGTLSLLPFQFSELPADARAKSLYLGNYPELVNKGYKYHSDWFNAYIDTYLTKDVRDFGRIDDLRAFQQLLNLLAANAATTLNASRLATELGYDIKTIQRWISILEASYIVFLLPPFLTNLNKRIVKSPKIYFYDTGLLAFLTGADSPEQYEKGPMSGALFENYIVSEVLKKERHNNTKSTLYFLRSHDGYEVDLIIDRKQTQEWIEIKKSETFREKMMRGLHKLKPKNQQGLILYNGVTQPYLPGIEILNYQEYLDE